MKRKTVTTYEEWLDVEAYGTYESCKKDGTEIWSYNGGKYYLNRKNLSQRELKELNYAKEVL